MYEQARKYITGNAILYKRNDSNERRGPCIVIGQINQQVFAKHGSFYFRVHPCRLQLVKAAFRAAERNNPSVRKLAKIIPPKITTNTTMKPHWTQKTT